MKSYGGPLTYKVTQSPDSKFMLGEKSEPRTNHIMSFKSPPTRCKGLFEQVTLTNCLKCWILTTLSKNQLKLSILRKWNTFPSWLSVLSCLTQIDNAKQTNLLFVVLLFFVFFLILFFRWIIHSSLFVFHLVHIKYSCSIYRKITSVYSS